MSELERDILVARVADAEASDAEWAAFRSWAQRDPSLWRELAELQRDAVELSSAVNRAVAAADAIEAPIGEHLGARLSERFRLVGAWAGWAAAAALALAWFAGVRLPEPGGMNRASMPVSLTPREALEQYLDRGRRAGTVVGEVPELVMLDSRPVADGHGFEVIFVRQIMERAVVDDLFRMATDADGRVVPLRLRPAVPGAGAN